MELSNEQFYNEIARHPALYIKQQRCYYLKYQIDDLYEAIDELQAALIYYHVELSIKKAMFY